MHSVVMESLEEYLSGALAPAARRDIEAHLGRCAACREEVHAMQEIGDLFESLKPAGAPVEPSLGFYAGILRNVEEQQPKPGFASLFALDLAFGRRLVFASLLTLAVLGSYFVSQEKEMPSGPSAEFVMAEDHSNAGPDRDRMLVTLASYVDR